MPKSIRAEAAVDRQARSALRKELARAQEEHSRLTVVIAYLHERLREADDEQGNPAQPPAPTLPKLPRTAVTNGPYSQMTAAKASEAVLAERGKPMRTPEIFDVITAGGAQIRDTDNLYRALQRSKKIRKEGRGLWGLAAWSPQQPNRSLLDDG